MVRSALAVVVALAASAPASARPGKVTRVERRGGGPHGMPRFCSVSVQPQGVESTGYCFGPRVDVGEVVDAVNGDRGVQLKISKVDPYTTSCATQGTTAVWLFHAAVITDTAPTTNPAGFYGMIDGGLDLHHAHVVDVKPPSGRTDQTDVGIDCDGDGNADFIFVMFGCDDNSQPSTSSTNQCYEMWVGDGRPSSSRRVHGEQLKIC